MMIGKKLFAVVLSLGILSAVSMTAFASTVTGTGRSSGGHLGLAQINFSITTKYNNGNPPEEISEMNCVSDPSATAYIETTMYTNDSVMPRIGGSGGDCHFEDDNNTLYCELPITVINERSVQTIDSTFHYNSSYLGSFTGGLTKYGFDR